MITCLMAIALVVMLAMLSSVPEATPEIVEVPKPVMVEVPTVVYKEPEWFCPLTDEELDYVQRVVMAESGNQPFEGQMAVAQCIYDRMQRDGETAIEVITKPNQFASPYQKEVTRSVKYAVYAVFHDGERVTDEPLYSFYSTVGGFVSSDHEAMNHVVTIKDHKFFN